MKKILVVLVVFIIGIAAGLYFYLYKGHRDIAAEKADFVTTVNTLQQEFASNSTTANTKYLDKTIEVSGKITNIDSATHAIVIDDKLYAVFKDSVLGNARLQKQVRVKGRFIGYDDLLEEFKIDQASFSD